MEVAVEANSDDHSSFMLGESEAQESWPLLTEFQEQWSPRERGFSKGEEAEVGFVETVVAIAEFTANQDLKYKTPC